MAARADGAAPGGVREVEGRNEVHLVGHVSGPVQQRELPSGDALVTFRLVVPRTGRAARAAAPEGARARGQAVDTFDVACWSSRTRAVALRLPEGQVVAVEGSLRRRFFRAAGASVSRHEVEAARVRRVGASR